MDPEASNLKYLSENYRAGISALYCHDERNFAIGYNDGQVFANWNHMDLCYKLNHKAITSIKLHENEFYTSCLDGTIRVLDLTNLKMRDEYFKC